MARRTSLEQLGVDVPELDGELPVGPEDAGAPQEPEAPPESEPTPDEPEAPAAERPAWLPPNFKSEEDFANSYKNLQDELRQRGNREREYQERLGQYEQQLAAQQQGPSQEEYSDQLAEAYEQNPLAVMQFIAAQTAQGMMAQLQQQQQAAGVPQLQAQNELLARTADQEMASAYSDWEEVKEAVGELLTERPYLLPDDALGSLGRTTQALDAAYKLVKADELIAQQQQFQQAGINQEDLDRASKLRGATLSGANGRPEPVSDADRELAGMKQALHGGSWAQLRSS